MNSSLLVDITSSYHNVHYILNVNEVLLIVLSLIPYSLSRSRSPRSNPLVLATRAAAWINLFQEITRRARVYLPLI